MLIRIAINLRVKPLGTAVHPGGTGPRGAHPFEPYRLDQAVSMARKAYFQTGVE